MSIRIKNLIRIFDGKMSNIFLAMKKALRRKKATINGVVNFAN
ncbi:hypothetical protein [Desulfosporosinus acidiphilus]|nr:hypothetical protein [Desulfosporosinus acidiphilus]